MAKDSKEWLKQASYDIGTARDMMTSKRYFYAVFMCHLSIEKALKGIYQERLSVLPPKTHNLLYLLNKIDLKPPEDIGRFIVNSMRLASPPGTLKKSGCLPKHIPSR